MKIQDGEIDTAVRAEREVEFARVDQSWINGDGVGIGTIGADVRPAETADIVVIGRRSNAEVMPKRSADGGEMKAERE